MKDKFKKIITSGFILLLISVVIGGIFINILPHQKSFFNSEPIYPLLDSWTVETPDSSEQPITLPSNLNVKEGPIILRYYGSYPAGINSLLFRTIHQSVEVFVDDSPIFSFGGPSQPKPFGKSPGNTWNIVRLPNDKDGKVLTIKLDSPYEKSMTILPEVTAGTKAALLFHLMQNFGGQLVAIISILMLGLGLILFHFLFRKLEGQSGSNLYLGLFAVCVSMWLGGECKMAEFFISNQSVEIFIAFEGLMLFSIPLLLFVTTQRNFHYKKIIHWLITLFLVNFVILNGLQIFEIKDFYETCFVTNILLTIEFAVLTAVLLLERLFHHNKHIMSALISFIVLGLFGLAELIHYLFSSGRYVGSYFSWGILIFLIMLSYSVIKSVLGLLEESRKTEYYKSLATTDLMTQIFNKTAYLRDLKEISNASHFAVIMADVNNLKLINDQYGHQTGDEAIIQVARLLKKHFRDHARCYRIGGDEFVCLLQYWREEEIKASISRMNHDFDKENADLPYHLEAAVGYAMFDKSLDKELKETIARADSRMYQLKENTRDSREE